MSVCNVPHVRMSAISWISALIALQIRYMTLTQTHVLLHVLQIDFSLTTIVVPKHTTLTLLPWKWLKQAQNYSLISHLPLLWMKLLLISQIQTKTSQFWLKKRLLISWKIKQQLLLVKNSLQFKAILILEIQAIMLIFSLLLTLNEIWLHKSYWNPLWILTPFRLKTKFTFKLTSHLLRSF